MGAFASATNDIASDGMYLIALKPDQQSFFVGMRSTFYRVGMITGQADRHHRRKFGNSFWRTCQSLVLDNDHCCCIDADTHPD
ncbi:hypothetical protein [Algoriphagus boritolerans]|uniref:hypothetical protein n=1 Tax=Algoriphagus boritolerans TaxID=308111 RepID=UPI000A564B73